MHRQWSQEPMPWIFLLPFFLKILITIERANCDSSIKRVCKSNPELRLLMWRRSLPAGNTMMPFVVKGNPISAPQTGLWQKSSKSFALRDQGHLFFTFTSMDSELKRWEARQQLILICWKAMSDRSGNLHQTSQPDLGRYVWTRSGTLPQTSQLNYESPLNRRLVFFARWYWSALCFEKRQMK